MEFIELISDAAIRLKKLFKNDEKYNAALFLLVEYLKGHLDRYEYEDDEQEVLEELCDKWFNSVEKLKNAKFSEDDILNVLLATNNIFKYEDDEEDYDDDDNEDDDDYEYDDDEDDEYEYDDDESEDDEEDDNMNYRKKKK